MNFDEDLAWYENNGSQSFTKRAIDSGNNGRAVAVADIDADNDLDISFDYIFIDNFFMV